MRPLLFILLAAFLFTDCKKNNSADLAIKNGTYKGTFQRITAGSGNISNVQFVFLNGTWSGGSDVVKYPALCHGRYNINQKEIHFENGCIWTAEFDWSRILSGDYKLSASGDSLQITREYPRLYKDKYLLKKQ